MATDWPDPGPGTGVMLVTGTDTGVGKTIVTAAIAAAAGAAGHRVAVVKPAQTGTAEGTPSDIAEVVRLAGPAHSLTLADYPEPLAPLIAARYPCPGGTPGASAGTAPLPPDRVVRAVRALAEAYDLVLVEGAGGLLVPMGEVAPGRPWTVADLDLDLAAVVVVRAGLGTLNHTELTLEALERREIPASVAVGAWPQSPQLVHRTNLGELLTSHPTTAIGRHRLAGIVPDGAGRLTPAAFRRAASGWLTPHLYGIAEVAAWEALV